MPKRFQLAVLETQKPVNIPADARKVPSIKPAKLTIDAKAVYKALTATAGAKDLIKQIPRLADFTLWLPWQPSQFA